MAGAFHCLRPILGSRFGPKVGSAIARFGGSTVLNLAGGSFVRAAANFSDLSPFLDPKYGLRNKVQNWITFSYLLLGLLGPRFGIQI